MLSSYSQLLAVVFLSLSLSCGGAPPPVEPSPTPPGPPIPSAPKPKNTPPQPLPTDCEAPRGMFGVSEALAASDHACHDWVAGCQGRVALSGSMSAALWTSATEARTTLMISAVHTLGQGWLAPGGKAAAASLRDPVLETGVTRLFLAGEPGRAREQASAMYMLFSPAIPADQTGHKLTRLRPRHDFFVALVDDQQYRFDSALAQEPKPLRRAGVVVPDPEGALQQAPSAAAMAAGDRVLLMGYPMQGVFAARVAASVALVLSDAEVAAALEQLRAAGDEEGSIPYDPEVEALVRGAAMVGMSGGPAFDTEGRLVGILVRGSTEVEPPGYARIVRLSFIVKSLREAYQALPEVERQAVAPFLSHLLRQAPAEEMPDAS